MTSWEKIEYILEQSLKLDLPMSETLELIHSTVVKPARGATWDYVPTHIFHTLATLAASVEERVKEEATSNG